MPDLAALTTAHLARGLTDSLFSGASIAVRAPSETVVRHGGTLAFDDDTPVDGTTLFDLASVSKTYTATVLVKLIEEGRIDPRAPLGPDLLPLTAPGTDAITIEMLLTHTSGLPSECFVWRDLSMPAPERLVRVLAVPLASAPGATFRYSCLGLITAGIIAERVADATLPDLAARYIIEPLGLKNTCYGPVDSGRAAATEDESYIGRGLVRGEVHDELNWFLGGKVGNAGLFSTASDVLRFAESFLEGSLLEPDSLHLMTTNVLKPEHGAEFGHGYGLRINDRNAFGRVPAFGHTGFTGTLWMVSPEHGLVSVILTNRVHPHRDRADLVAFRCAVANSLLYR